MKCEGKDGKCENEIQEPEYDHILDLNLYLCEECLKEFYKKHWEGV